MLGPFMLERRKRRRAWFSEIMKTVFVTGSDTNVGKTWVTGTLAALLTERGYRVQVVKPVETGVADAAQSDSQVAIARCEDGKATAHTLASYPLPIAPVSAAKAAGHTLRIDILRQKIDSLPECEWRIVEGAGSLASPLQEDGADWADFASALRFDRIVLVVEDKVGAIGQARMLHFYARSKGLEGGVWLNEIREQSKEERKGTRDGIEALELPLWATQARGDSSAILLEDVWK